MISYIDIIHKYFDLGSGEAGENEFSIIYFNFSKSLKFHKLRIE